MKKYIICALLILGLSAKASMALDYEPDRVFVYKKIGATELKLHAFEPEGHQSIDKAPAIVFFFGGGWNGGTVKQFYEQADYFAKQGIVAISAEYRIKSEHNSTPFDAVEDAKSAIRYVRQHAAELGIDPTKIIASGGSAGGHVAACTGVIDGLDSEHEDLTVSSVPNLMILFNPVLDTNKERYRHSDTGKHRMIDISPNNHVRPGIVPTLLLHGTADETVPFEDAERFAHLMKEAGNTCELIPFEGKVHGFFNGSYFRPNTKDLTTYNRCIEECERFLRAQVLNTVTLNHDGFNVILSNNGTKVENKFTWIVNVPEAADYQVAFQYHRNEFNHSPPMHTPEDFDRVDPNCAIKIEANGKVLYTKLQPLFHYNEPPKVYGSRQWLEGVLPLKEGANKITFYYAKLADSNNPLAKDELGTDALSESSLPIKFNDIDLVRPEVWTSMKQRAEKLKPDLSWMIDGKYGIFTHWSLRSYPLYGDTRARETFEWGVNKFDVEAYANKIEETGASWVIFTTCHGGQMFPAPIKTLSDVLPGTTTERDLIAEIAEALNKRNIKLLLYYNFSPGGEVAKKLGADKDPEKWFKYLIDFVREVSLRYGTSIAGWGYFDSTVPAYEMNMPWEQFYMAAIAGNPDAAVGISTHWRAQYSPFNNLQTGDSGGALNEPLDKRLLEKGERYEGLQEHATFILDDFWYSKEPFNGVIRASSEVEGGPTFSDKDYITYFKKMADAHVPVTVNILITQDVTSEQPFMNQKSIDLMKKIKKELGK